MSLLFYISFVAFLHSIFTYWTPNFCLALLYVGPEGIVMNRADKVSASWGLTFTSPAVILASPFPTSQARAPWGLVVCFPLLSVTSEHAGGTPVMNNHPSLHKIQPTPPSGLCVWLPWNTLLPLFPYPNPTLCSESPVLVSSPLGSFPWLCQITWLFHSIAI